MEGRSHDSSTEEYVKLLCIAIIFKYSKEVGADCHVSSQNIQMTSSYLTKLDILLGLRLSPLQNYQKCSNQILWDIYSEIWTMKNLKY